MKTTTAARRPVLSAPARVETGARGFLPHPKAPGRRHLPLIQIAVIDQQNPLHIERMRNTVAGRLIYSEEANQPPSSSLTLRRVYSALGKS